MLIQITNKDVKTQLDKIAAALEISHSEAAFLLIEFGSIFLFLSACKDINKSFEEWRKQQKRINPQLLKAFDIMHQPYKKLVKIGVTLKDVEVLVANRDRDFKA